MESNVQRFSVISKTPNSKEENRLPSTPLRPMSQRAEPPKPWTHESMRRSKHLPKHIIILEGKQVKYRCTVCSTSFKSKSNCCYHKHCGNDGEKPFTCPICARKFSTKTHFSYHTLMHSGLDPFKCRECGKTFKTKNKLRRHQQVHTEMQKRFFCDECGRAFLRKSSVQVHKRVHTGVKPYQCNECPKAFREKKNLIFHLSHHTGIKNWVCEVCGKSYSIKWDLELHKRTHSRVRPFLCTVSKCQQTFSQKRYLKRHMATHKNYVKFICSICEKEFSRKDNLQRHIINTHLESQNPNITKAEKAKQVLDTAPYIKTINVCDETDENVDEIALNEGEKVPVVRTESVIVSATTVRTDREADIRHRVSVIRTVGDVASNTNECNREKASHLDDSCCCNDDSEEIRTNGYPLDQDAVRDPSYLEPPEENVNSDIRSMNQDHLLGNDNDSILLRLFESADNRSVDADESFDQDQSLVAYCDRIPSENILFRRSTVTWEISNDNRLESDFNETTKEKGFANYDFAAIEDFDRDSSLGNDEPSELRGTCVPGGQREEAIQEERTSPPIYHDLRNYSVIDSNPLSHSAIDAYANSTVEIVSHFVPHFVPERIATESLKPRCMLPKKVIAASYRDSFSVSEDGSATADVIKVAMRDSYKLLDLSMKSQ